MIGSLGADLQKWDGWVPFPSATYVSATSFSVPGDFTSIISPGDKFMLTQNGAIPANKYFYILSPVVFSGGVTTFTITGGSDYSLTNATIFGPAYSKVATPAGFPQWFNYTPTYTGWSVTPATTYATFSIIGRMVTVNLQTTNTTSNATTASVTLPVATLSGRTNAYPGLAVDNGADTLASYAMTSASTLMNVYKVTGVGTPFGAWTATGTKGLRLSGLSYEF